MSIRDEIVSYLTSLKLKNFKVSSEVPFLPNGTELYVKNPKTIYTDTEQITTEPFMKLFNRTIDQEVTAIAIYLATDAKQLPPDYNSVVGLIRDAKEITTGRYNTRASEVSTEYLNDLLVTQIVIRLSRVIN